MSTVTVDDVYIHGSIRFLAKGYDTPITLPADGVLEIEHGTGSFFVIANGETLKGIRYTFPSGATMPEEWDSDDVVMAVIVAEDGGLISVSHEDAMVTSYERCNVTNGADTVINDMPVQVFYRYVPSLAEQRWRISSWLTP